MQAVYQLVWVASACPQDLSKQAFGVKIAWALSSQKRLWATAAKPASPIAELIEPERAI
jgi:hypothetical protein